MSVLVLDNYDSFTFNLVHILRELEVPHQVFRNDKISVAQAAEFEKILFSPGPGIPEEAGHMPEIISKYLGKKPLLGICLGHQAIAECLGAELENMDKVYHGVGTEIFRTGSSVLLNGLPQTFQAGRYHSWKVKGTRLPEHIKITAADKEGSVMALEAEGLHAYGVQFHPESILTPLGKEIIQNFTEL
ncbi:aminodeoxychorismate/anthranilate synthase component II [Cryomorphaceae bacterium]|nr:aminodeoxychorismate/anthranilate synthase component II [Cryomorphaceae bacterium]